MWRAIFIRFSNPCVVPDALTDAMLGVDMLTDAILGFDMSIGIGIIVTATPAITLEFMVGVARAVNMLGALGVVIVSVASAIGVDRLADVNANGLAAVITPLEFALTSPREESMTFC